MRIAISTILVLFSHVAFAQTLPLVPKPLSVELGSGSGPNLPANLAVSVTAEWQQHLEVFGEYLDRVVEGEQSLSFDSDDSSFLIVIKDATLKPEEYVLEIAENSISLRASTIKGLAHGTATLLQLAGNSKGNGLPLATIKDAPAVPYRNFMVDMGRNPHSIELLKETVDLLWFYKVDSLQLHLTDDQRFAWPSTAFPKLWDGIVTLDEFRELEAYAVARGVTIIPELEVPGHSGKLRQIYPEVFGKSPTDLATNETALKGIKTLLDELMNVFASTPYIHIGGDEAYGVPVVAQRTLINQLHSYLKSQGRQTVVWEGPDEGKGDNKVNEEVIHINWRTIAYRPDEMLEAGYRVINAAWDPLYIVDHYPRINFTMTSPQHIYETLELTRFKHVNPGIPTFAKPIDVAPSDQLLGFCMPWWEGREENYFTQIVPRLLPFAEVAWQSDPQRNFDKFSSRVAATEAVRKAACYPVSIIATSMVIPDDGVFHDKTSVNLSAGGLDDQQVEIRYTLDGKAPTNSSSLFQAPFEITSSTVVRAAAFVDSAQISHGSRLQLTCVNPVPNLALGKPVTSSAPSGKPFSVARLTDGGISNLDFYLGYPAEPEPVEVTIDLGSKVNIDRVVVYAYSISNSFEKYTVQVSEDGLTFETVGSNLEKPTSAPKTEQGVARATEHKFSESEARFVRVVSYGNKGYVFDSFSKLVEIQVFAAQDDVESVSKTIQPVEADYRRLAFYPDRWKESGIDFQMLAWEGEKVTLFTRQGQYDQEEITAFVTRLDEGWQVYSDLIGQQPRPFKTYNDKPVICALPKSNLSCGYGCGYVGATGIEASAFYSIDLPNFRKQPKSFQHYYFYEMGRNFFVFGDRHSIFTTGYAVFMRYVCMDSLNCKDLDLQTRRTIESCEEVYAKSDIGFMDAFTNLGSGEKSNRLRDANGRLISPSDQPVMVATAMLKLRRDFGGDEWVERFYHALRKCDSVRATSLQTAQTQVFNWLVCSSIAAQHDLSGLFADRWRMPISPKQRESMKRIDWTEEDLSPKQIVSLLLSTNE